jgi:hypothetical protein
MGQGAPWEVKGCPLVAAGHGALRKMPRRSTTRNINAQLCVHCLHIIHTCICQQELDSCMKIFNPDNNSHDCLVHHQLPNNIKSLLKRKQHKVILRGIFMDS